VDITVVVEGRTTRIKVDPKILVQNLVHKVAQALSIDLPGWWHASVVDGIGDNQTYQENDTINLYPASQESIEMMREPRTPKGSAAKIPKAVGGPPLKRREPKQKRDWIQELCERREVPIQDAKQFSDQIIIDRMITMTTDGGANPNPGPTGWGVLVRQNGKFLCLWKHYPKSSNNVMELSAVIAGLNDLPSGMVVWLSTDSQYVQKGMCEWMPKWKKNCCRNSKKAGVAQKYLWLALEAAVARHRRIESTWVKAHSGIIHNEIANTLATKGVKDSTYCPIDWFDKLPADTEEEDGPSIPPSEVITQTDEFGADEEHLPSFGTPAIVYGFNDEEAAERAEEERERGIRHFLPVMCDNSSTPVTDDEDMGNMGNPRDVVLIAPGMTVEDSGSEQHEPPQEQGFSFQVGHVGPVDMPESVAPSPRSSTWAQARAEAQQRREAEVRFSWMRDSDLQMLTMGLEPYAWDHFAEAASHSGETQFQAIEQRTCSEEVLETGEPPGPDSLVGATLVVRSQTIVTALKMVSYGWKAPGATARRHGFKGKIHHQTDEPAYWQALAGAT
jgi:ribonuclease HI